MSVCWRKIAVGLMVWGGISSPASALKIAIAQIVEHPALNQAREGIQEKFPAETQWEFLNAQGNSTIAAQIAQKVHGESYDLIMTLSTPMSQNMARTETQKPIIFGAVSDPLNSKLVSSLKAPDKNITGVMDAVPVKDQFDLLLKILPQAKTIGLVYNPGEDNALLQVKVMEEEAKARGLTLIHVPVYKSSDVGMASQKLVGQADAVLLPLDNTVITALESLLKVTNQYNIPVFGSDTDIVRRGALGALGVNWKTIGHQMAALGQKVLAGTPMKDLPVETPKIIELHLNPKAAKTLGIDLPPHILKDATLVDAP